MKSFGVLGGLLALSLSFVVGCGDDSPSSPGKGGSAGSGGTGAMDDGGAGGGDDVAGSGAGGSAGSTAGNGGTMGSSGGSAGATAGAAGNGGSGGTGLEPTKFESQPAGITLEIDAESKERGLTLASSSITQENDTDLHYIEWLGELYNGSDETLCLISMTGDFQSAAGTSVVEFTTYAYGRAYDLGASKLSSPCVAPGESVPVWSNDLPGKALDLSSISKLVVTLNPIASPDAVVHPSTPTFTPVQKTYDDLFEAWQISTTATAAADIYNASVTFWGKSGKFYVDSAKDYHLEDFPKGATWVIDTAPLGLETTTLTEVVTYFDFIDGLKGPSPSRVYDQQTLALLTVRDDAVTRWDATRARRDQARKLLR